MKKSISSRRGIKRREFLMTTGLAAVALIVLTVLACNIIGDGLRDALDPRMEVA